MADIYVISQSDLMVAGKTYRCAIGKAGFALPEHKCEGDNKTPTGVYPLREGWLRVDKKLPVQGQLSFHPISRQLGWCDEAEHALYNQPVALPFDASHEALWHEQDDCYDVIIPIGYNDNPPQASKGSAIFFHIAHADYRGTEGCVAVSKADMLEIVSKLTSKSSMHILPKVND